ncbi:MAG: FAD-dependent oxidoreductase, partial [Chloroflexi bacterium]|nr:FAD-dependent oxidoreductase [Chloroflexota bacterium]
LIEKLGDAKNLTIYLEHKTEKIEGQDFVQRLFIKDLKTGQSKQLEVGGVFVEIGLVPNSGAVKHLIKLNELGEVPVNCATETELPGLYAAGDVTTVPEKQIIVAAGEGAKAALQAQRYLQHLAK